MPEPIARVRPNRTKPGVPALDPLVEDLVRADETMGQTIVERHVAYSGRILSVERDVARTASGDLVSRDVVTHSGAAVIAPLDAQGRLIMVTQYRLPAGGTLLELPAGTLDVHEGRVEDPLVAAHRELEEETGLRAGSMERIAGYWSAPGFSTEYLTLYLATDLRAAGPDRLSPDADEELDVVALPLADAVAAVDAGLIEDAKSIAGILLVARRLGVA